MIKNTFAKHVLTLMKGTTIAQIIPILISPILTRLYTPEQFGVFAIYIAVISVLTPIVNARYELAISLPKSEKKAVSIFLLTLIINVVVSLGILIIVMAFGNEITGMLGTQESDWIYLLFIGVFLVGILNSLTYLNNRWNRFNNLAKSKINQSFVIVIVQLFAGFTKFGSLGLVLGYCAGQIVAIKNLGSNISIINIIQEKKISKRDIKEVGNEYKSFPQFAMISHSSESLSSNIPNLLLSKFFETQYTGYYSLTTRTISLPLSLIGKAVGDVFLSTASKLYREQGNCKDLYKKTFKILALIPIIPFIVMFFFAEELFSIVFGPEWSVAGTYTKILIPALYLQFISSPLSHMFIIAEKIKTELIITTIVLLLSVTSFLVGYYYFNSTVISLVLYSLVLVFKYIVFIMLSYKFSLNKKGTG